MAWVINIILSLAHKTQKIIVGCLISISIIYALLLLNIGAQVFV